MKKSPLRSPLFQHISPEDEKFLKKYSTLKSFRKDEIVFKKGSPSETLHVVLSGQVKLFNVRSGSSKEEIVCLIGAGGYFCLAPMLSREILHISARALEDSRIMMIPRSAIEQMIDQSHVFSKNVIHALANKECDLCEQVCDLSLTTTKERLAKYLLEQSAKAGLKKWFKLPVRQIELASYLGTVRETLSRDFSALRKAKVIRVSTEGITILNERELRNIADRKQHDLLPTL